MTRAGRFWLTLSAVAALALSAPALADDPRLRTLVFDEAEVVRIDGKVLVQTTIKFAPDEVIENVAIGDSAAWQVQPNRAQTILFVKPLDPTARTNMTVVTSERTYLFDLVASPKNAALYVLQFRYPELEKAEEEARRLERLARDQNNRELANAAQQLQQQRRHQRRRQHQQRETISIHFFAFYLCKQESEKERKLQREKEKSKIKIKILK